MAISIFYFVFMVTCNEVMNSSISKTSKPCHTTQEARAIVVVVVSLKIIVIFTQHHQQSPSVHPDSSSY